MALASIGVAALGFLSPDSHGALLTAMVVIYLVLGFAAGPHAVRSLCTFAHSPHPPRLPGLTTYSLSAQPPAVLSQNH